MQNKIIIDFIKNDKTEEIKDLLKHKKCKINLIQYITISKYILLLTSSILLFINSSLNKEDYKTTVTILSILSGIENILVLSSDKIIQEYRTETEFLDLFTEQKKSIMEEVLTWLVPSFFLKTPKSILEQELEFRTLQNQLDVEEEILEITRDWQSHQDNKIDEASEDEALSFTDDDVFVRGDL